MKGGGLNFGIVTRFDLEAMLAINLAYGQSFISSNYSDEIIDTLVEFTDRTEEEGHDALIVIYTHDEGFPEDIVIFLIRANTLGDLETTSFERLDKIPSFATTWETKSLAKAANDSQVPAGTK